MGGGGDPVWLGAARRGWKTFGAVTAIQLCRRKRDSLTVLPGTDGNLDDGVADVRGGLALREHVLRGPGQGDIQQRRDVGWGQAAAGALRRRQGRRGPVVQRSLGQLG